MRLGRVTSRPNDIQLKRDQVLREQIRVACKAVLDAPAGIGGRQEDEEYKRILELRQLLPR
jgi:hypothetical protein